MRLKNMKPSINYLSRCLTACIFLLAGCVELDVVPTNKFTDDTYWSSVEKASSLLSMGYRQMNDVGRIFRDERLSDNLYNSYGNDDVRVTANGQANTSTAMFDNYWGDMYGGIKTTHTFLANVDRVEGMDEALRNRMKAEARFIRAFLFFQLTNWYGDVPFFTEDITLEIATTISPTPQTTIVDFIHSELEEVAEILPTSYGPGDKGRITAGAAMAFNARVALNFNDWERVKTYTDKLINSTQYGTYTLFPSYEGIFHFANQYNSEIILDIQYAPEVRTWSEISTYVPFSLTGVQYIQASPTQDLVDTYLMKDGTKWDESKDPYADRDPRLDMTIYRHGSPINRRDIPDSVYNVNVDPNDPDNDTNDKIGRENGTQTGYFYRKFYDPNPAAWTGGTSWNCNINFVVLRFADVLLMHAEAMNELDQMDAAVWDKTIKPLRERAGFDNTALARDFPGGGKDALRAIIRDERRVELALEGTRVYDIRRWRIAETVMNAPRRGAKFDLSTGSLKYYEYRNNTFNENRDYLWAIPRQQWLINKNLGQNDGY
ncbi:RagB/SusD family nutrient uptake outer membrane protein [Dawidia soli]|uniref:RagB/SusD family nutrient uptake outer membrane protein n=1 Tax=Dawidia soli TaxID=2782352 RepID=A0AAP2DCY7_9BACT|nr:RagB/SusD family nutrient uptake outer membrane protein [Dawidia soli]MBT1687087.1 RagB/SusD family nutrient uptake outer membrane protein [Dawidia soli]